MSNYKPSKYQQTIYNFISNDTRNAVINAVAGSGKTTTLVEALKLIPAGKETIFLAFNKSIVEELKTRTPQNVEVKTMHSLGWSGIIKRYGRVKLESRKIHNIVYNMSKMWKDEYGRPVDAGYQATIRKLVDLARYNLVNDKVKLEELALRHDIEIYNGECERALMVIDQSNMNKVEFDFTDMVYQPVIDSNIRLPKYDYVFVDECQDLNKAQQEIIKSILKPEGRFVCVGDRQQAIYGFAGADVESFNNLTQLPNTITLPLSVNYRCGRNILKLAQGIVPEIEPHDNAIDGEVKSDASYKEIEDGDMILCRNTLPLVKMCLQFLANEVKAYVKGGDIGVNLINLVKKSKISSLKGWSKFADEERDTVLVKLRKKYPFYTSEEIKNDGTYRILDEKLQVIEAIINNDRKLKTADRLIDKISQIFTDEKDGICFSTIHKSKGLESKRVFIIESYLMPSPYAKKDWQLVQESNLTYVAYTRAKEYLGFVSDWNSKNGRIDLKK